MLDLLNQSMVQRVEPTNPEDTTLRFRLLLTLREYAIEQLAAFGELAEMEERRAHYYLSRVEQGASVQELANEGYWLDQIAAELDNVRAAFTWSLQQPTHIEIAIRLATAAVSFWLKRGYLAEGRRWLEQAIAHRAAVPPGLQARAYSAMGTLAWYQEEYQAAQAHLQTSLTLWQTLGAAADQDAMARIYLSLGGIARQHDHYAAAMAYHTAALAIQRALNNQQGIADALHNLGVAETFLGQYAAAEQCFAECYAIDCALGDQWGMFLDLNSWGVLDYVRSNYAAARFRLTEGLTIARRLGAKTRLSLLLSHLGKVALAEGQWTEAHRCFQEALTIAEEVGIKSQRFAAQLGVSLLLLHQERDTTAWSHLVRCVTIWQEDRKPKDLLSLLDVLALYFVRNGAAAKAVHLVSFTQFQREEQQLPPREAIYLPLHEQTVTQAHLLLTAEQYDAACAQGRTQTLETVIQLLVGDLSETPSPSIENPRLMPLVHA
ncbi:MAG: tetratricopeptide repeat protein [Caldilineaceae bacterium]